MVIFLIIYTGIWYISELSKDSPSRYCMVFAHWGLQSGQLSSASAKETQTWWKAYQGDFFYMCTLGKLWLLKCGLKVRGMKPCLSEKDYYFLKGVGFLFLLLQCAGSYIRQGSKKGIALCCLDMWNFIVGHRHCKLGQSENVLFRQINRLCSCY